MDTCDYFLAVGTLRILLFPAFACIIDLKLIICKSGYLCLQSAKNNIKYLNLSEERSNQHTYNTLLKNAVELEIEMPQHIAICSGKIMSYGDNRGIVFDSAVRGAWENGLSGEIHVFNTSGGGDRTGGFEIDFSSNRI